MTIKDLLEKRVNLVNQAREILDAAENEKRNLTAEDEQRYDALMAEVDQVREDVDRRERVERETADLAGSNGRAVPAQQPGEQRAQEFVEYRGIRVPRMPEAQRSALNQWFAAGRGEMTPDERRALSAGTDIYGGYITAPQQFVTDLIMGVDNQVFMRNLGRVFTLSQAESLGAPSLDNDPADANWTTEILTGSEDSTMSFGKRELYPRPVAKLLKVSNTLLRRSVIPVEGLVRDRLAYKFGVTLEACYLTGTGAGQPLGVFTASASGISTSRDVSTGNLATSIQTDGLIEAKYTLKGQYWGRARWIFHRDAVKQIRKLKDGDGQYIWSPGIGTTAPDRILEAPYVMSEYAPNTFTSALYVGILGDFSFYWIADALSMTMQRLDELYAATNQVGFIGRFETDGMPVLEEAFVRVKLA